MRKLIPAAAALLLASAAAFAQNNEKKDIPTMASEAADYLDKILGLEVWQIYQIDSTFLHNFTEMTKEMDVIRKKGATNSELYQQASDKWMEASDESIRKILTDEQWQKYMKSTTYGKAKREREKRNAKKAARK